MSEDQQTPWTFSDVARRASCVLGTPVAFALACATILAWGVTGPLFGYSDTWQLIINTGTTIITFLMVFLVQNTQNRDARALHLKLDELLRSMKDARNRLINLENCSDEEIDQIERQFKALRRREERNGTAPMAQRKLDRRHFPVSAGIFFGLGLGGFFAGHLARLRSSLDYAAARVAAARVGFNPTLSKHWSGKNSLKLAVGASIGSGSRRVPTVPTAALNLTMCGFSNSGTRVREVGYGRA